MGIIDIIIVLVFLFGLYLGYQRGFIKQVSDFIILFISSFVAGMLSDILFGLLYNFFPFFNFSGKAEGIKSINIIFWKLFLYVSILILMIFAIRKILTKLKLTDKIMDSIVEANLLSRGLGSFFSIPLTLVIIFNVSLVLLSPNFNMTMISNSKLDEVIMEKTIVLSSENKNLYNNQKYIINRINKKDNTIENYAKVNDDIIGNMIDTNLVSENIIDELKKEDKLLGTRKQDENPEETNDVNDENQNNENINNDSVNEDNNSTETNTEINVKDDDSSIEESDDMVEEESADDKNDIIEETDNDHCEKFPGDC